MSKFPIKPHSGVKAMYRLYESLGVRCFILSLLVFQPAWGQQAEYLTNFLCKSGKEVRSIKIEKSGSGCVATYTKTGVDQVVGKSSVENNCSEVVNKIKSNLEKGNWSCKDISNSRISRVAD